MLLSKDILLINLPLVTGGIISMLAWGCCPQFMLYGRDFWYCIVFIILFRLIKKGIDNNCFSFLANIQKKENIITIIFLLVFIAINAKWFISFINTAIERKSIIENAVASKKQEIKIPSYPDSLPTNLLSIKYLNAQKHYDTEYYKKYYKIRIIID